MHATPAMLHPILRLKAENTSWLYSTFLRIAAGHSVVSVNDTPLKEADDAQENVIYYSPLGNYWVKTIDGTVERGTLPNASIAEVRKLTKNNTLEKAIVEDAQHHQYIPNYKAVIADLLTFSPLKAVLIKNKDLLWDLVVQKTPAWVIEAVLSIPEIAQKAQQQYSNNDIVKAALKIHYTPQEQTQINILLQPPLPKPALIFSPIKPLAVSLEGIASLDKTEEEVKASVPVRIAVSP
jgi:hypothetical protein